MVNRIPTRYHLTHSDPSFSDQDLQECLYEAASLLVRGNKENLIQTGAWFKANGFTNVGPGGTR